MVGEESRDQPNAPAGHGMDNGKAVGRRIGFVVAPEQGGLRLDLFLTAREIGLSRTQIGRAVDEGQVQVNSRTGRAGRKLKSGDVVAIVLPAARPSGVIPEAIPLPWTDAVPYMAAHLAYQELQNWNAAKFYEQQFDKMTLGYSGQARPGRAVNQYGRY